MTYHEGDIIRIRKDRNGLIEGVEKMYDGAAQAMVGTDPSGVDPTSQSRHLVGNVYERMGTTMLVSLKDPAEVTKRSELEYVFGDAYKYVVRYDRKTGNITREGLSQAKPYTLYKEDYTQLFSYTRYSDPELLVIFE